MKTKISKRKSSEWLQKNSELTTYAIMNTSLDGTPIPKDVLDKIDSLKKELDKL